MNKSEATDVLSPQSLLEMAMAFQRSRVLLTAAELDVFSVLGADGKTSGQVARVLGTDERATDRLMNALCALKLLEKRDGRFFNSPLAARFLVRGEPQYFSGLGHLAHLWENWNTLTQAVRTGRSVSARPIDDRDADWLEAFIAAMHWRARQHAPEVVAMLDLTGVSRVLDVGAGSGAYSVAFARAKEEIAAVALDLFNVIPMTEQYIAQEGLSRRVETVVGNYEVEALGSGFDLVFMSAIIHSNSPDQNRALIRKGADALTPTGQLVVQDFIMDEDRTGPPFGALFALNMLVGTPAGDTYTESEVRSWMEAAGLQRIERKDTPFGTTLIIGRFLR